MTPVEGYVVEVREPFLGVKLKSGGHIWVPQVKDLGFGDKVWVCYDYTRMIVREVLTDYEYHEADQAREPEADVSDPDRLPAHKYVLVNH